YLLPLYFGILLAALLSDVMLTHLVHRRRIYGWVIFLVLIAFVFFSPLSYGIPLSQSSYQMRQWLPSWN
ncbi:MAG: dolichyl-phosphate-mannose--protein O-mannosyl transferase, partial [Parcubacteria group bacterium]|nr:dolichyl-phosphate-mannose--protein O-mannosyl transferase [Parcubacteria group bacterium]